MNKAEKLIKVIEAKYLELYHVTLTKNVAKIKKEGIVAKKKPTFTGAFGQDIRHHKGSIYAITDLENTYRWAHSLGWDSKESVSIIKFRSDADWEKDTHPQAGLTGNNSWVYSDTSVKPEDIIEIKPFDPNKLRVNPDGSLKYLEEATNKTLYKGVFSWHNEAITVYKHAFSDKQAKYLMLTDVANKTGYKIDAIRNIYSDPSKYKIEISK